MSDGPAPANVQLTRSGGLTLAHGTAVATDGRGLLFIGGSGRGKSALALQLLAFGAVLVGDDRVAVAADGDGVLLSPPPAIAGRIEARGIGILAVPATEARLSLIVDLDHTEDSRLPPERRREFLGHGFPLVHKVESPHFAAALWQYLRFGRAA